MSEGKAVVEEFRKMARVVLVDDVIPHPNADKLELAIIGGWQCCIKLGEFKKGDKALYCEIDALVPTIHPSFSFLEERKEGLKSFNGVSYSRIKTIKLRKEISQGLLLPLPDEFKDAEVDTNLSEQLGVLKYEKSESKVDDEDTKKQYSLYHRFALWLYGSDRPNLPFPAFLRKSEESRVQNINSQFKVAHDTCERFEMTVKLDGESMTVYSHRNEKGKIVFGVCSRNMELYLDDLNYTPTEALRKWLGKLLLRNRRAITLQPYIHPQAVTGVLDWVKQSALALKQCVRINVGLPKWVSSVKATDDRFVKYVSDNQLFDKLAAAAISTNGKTYSVQGELIGPGIQGNYEGVDKLSYYVYRVFDSEGNVLTPYEARIWCSINEFAYVPVLEAEALLPETIKDLVKQAEGKRYLAKGGKREGIVLKSNTRDFSFKVISESYLLNEK